MSNTFKARRTAQRHAEPIDSPTPTTGLSPALHRGEIQLHQLQHGHKLPQPGKHHRTQKTSHKPVSPWGQTPQARTMSFNFFFFNKSQCFFPATYFYLHGSLLQCCGVFLFVFVIFFFPLLFFFTIVCVCVIFYDFVFDLFDCFSYSSLLAKAIPEYM